MYKPTKKHDMKRIYQIIGIALLCVVAIYTSYSITMAWFMDESVTSNGPNIMVVGTVDLKVETDFNFYNLVLAPDTYYIEEDGKRYGTYLTTNTNNDTKSIYVRCKVEIEMPPPVDPYTKAAELTLYFVNQETRKSNITTGDGNSYVESRDLGKWFYNSSDDYYYYIGSVGTEEVEFNSGYHVNNALNNKIAKEDVSINLTFESIQRPYGAYVELWTTAPKVFTDFAKSDTLYPET